jgi:hypothetical protein
LYHMLMASSSNLGKCGDKKRATKGRGRVCAMGDKRYQLERKFLH